MCVLVEEVEEVEQQRVFQCESATPGGMACWI